MRSFKTWVKTGSLGKGKQEGIFSQSIWEQNLQNDGKKCGLTE